jgi:hypothetical protein
MNLLDILLGLQEQGLCLFYFSFHACNVLLKSLELLSVLLGNFQQQMKLLALIDADFFDEFLSLVLQLDEFGLLLD